jgi:hypothetical protein
MSRMWPVSSSSAMRSRRGRGALTAVVFAALALPSAADAHGLVGKQDLPIPRWLFAWAATLVLVASFVGLAALWSKPCASGRC